MQFFDEDFSEKKFNRSLPNQELVPCHPRWLHDIRLHGEPPSDEVTDYKAVLKKSIPQTVEKVNQVGQRRIEKAPFGSLTQDMDKLPEYLRDTVDWVMG